MVSLVFCTRKSDDKYIKHLIKTSGLSNNLEVIEIVNDGISLSKCYSDGLERSKNDIVVFCHDDLIIETKNWGKKLIKNFSQSDFGILGLAGSTKMSEDGVWWSDKHLMLGIVNHLNNGKKWSSNYSKNFGDTILESVVLDGLFFAVKKDRLKYEFDLNVDGFHFYDVD